MSATLSRSRSREEVFEAERKSAEMLSDESPFESFWLRCLFCRMIISFWYSAVMESIVLFGVSRSSFRLRIVPKTLPLVPERKSSGKVEGLPMRIFYKNDKYFAKIYQHDCKHTFNLSIPKNSSKMRDSVAKFCNPPQNRPFYIWRWWARRFLRSLGGLDTFLRFRVGVEKLIG